MSRSYADILSIFIYFPQFAVIFFTILRVFLFSGLKSRCQMEYAQFYWSAMYVCMCLTMLGVKRNAEKSVRIVVYMGRSLTFICRFTNHLYHCQFVNFSTMCMANRGWHKSNTNHYKIKRQIVYNIEFLSVQFLFIECI